MNIDNQTVSLLQDCTACREIRPDQDLRRDLGFTSDTLEELLQTLESELGIRLHEQNRLPARIRTVQDLLNLTRHCLTEPPKDRTSAVHSKIAAQASVHAPAPCRMPSSRSQAPTAGNAGVSASEVPKARIPDPTDPSLPPDTPSAHPAESFGPGSTGGTPTTAASAPEAPISHSEHHSYPMRQPVDASDRNEQPEFEKKIWLTQAEYQTILSCFPEAAPGQVQKNTYFDTEDFAMHRQGITCRVREKNGRCYATVKRHAIQGSDGNLERTQEVSGPDDPRAFAGMGLRPHGSLTTLRTKLLQNRFCTMVLDQNTYLDTIDYELEIEYAPGHGADAGLLLCHLEKLLCGSRLLAAPGALLARAGQTNSKSARWFLRMQDLRKGEPNDTGRRNPAVGTARTASVYTGT